MYGRLITNLLQDIMFINELYEASCNWVGIGRDLSLQLIPNIKLQTPNFGHQLLTPNF